MMIEMNHGNTDVDEIKRWIIVALVSDDEVFQRLVLKGGNALRLIHKLESRASFDLDFSMEGDFEAAQLTSMRERIEFRLKQTLLHVGYVVFDVRLEPRPENITPDLQDYWGGYSLEFRIIRKERFDTLEGKLDAIRREAVPSRPGGRARFEIDISRHEYCIGKQPVELNHFAVYVYTPAMIACEKIRAICQQLPSYAHQVKNQPAPRARDFFDIHAILTHFEIDVFSAENTKLLRSMFSAKRVSLRLLHCLDQQRELHRQNWPSLVDTVDPRALRNDFDFYFEFVLKKCQQLNESLTE